jgi:hypothetical protein
MKFSAKVIMHYNPDDKGQYFFTWQIGLNSCYCFSKNHFLTRAGATKSLENQAKKFNIEVKIKHTTSTQAERML